MPAEEDGQRMRRLEWYRTVHEPDCWTDSRTTGADTTKQRGEDGQYQQAMRLERLFQIHARQRG